MGNNNDEAGAVAVTSFCIQRLSIAPSQALPVGEKTGSGPAAVVQLQRELIVGLEVVESQAGTDHNGPKALLLLTNCRQVKLSAWNFARLIK